MEPDFSPIPLAKLHKRIHIAINFSKKVQNFLCFLLKVVQKWVQRGHFHLFSVVQRAVQCGKEDWVRWVHIESVFLPTKAILNRTIPNLWQFVPRF